METSLSSGEEDEEVCIYLTCFLLGFPQLLFYNILRLYLFFVLANPTYREVSHRTRHFTRASSTEQTAQSVGQVEHETRKLSHQKEIELVRRSLWFFSSSLLGLFSRLPLCGVDLPRSAKCLEINLSPRKSNEPSSSTDKFERRKAGQEQSIKSEIHRVESGQC